MNMINSANSQADYAQFLVEIKERIHKSRYETAKMVNREILQPLVAEISWSKHLVIMSKCKDLPESYRTLLPSPEMIAEKLVDFDNF